MPDPLCTSPAPTHSATRAGIVALVVTVAAAACSPSPELAEEPRRMCARTPSAAVDLEGSTPSEVSLAASTTLLDCADDLVLTTEELLAPAALHAIERNAPLLVVSPTTEQLILEEVTRLEPRDVALFGDVESGVVPESVSVERRVVDDGELADAETADLADVGTTTSATPEADASRDGEGSPETTSQEVTAGEPDNEGEEPEQDEGPAVLWLAPDAGLAWAAVPTIRHVGGEVIERTAASDAPVAEVGDLVGVIGTMDPSDRWRLSITSTPPVLPGGGHDLFPDRRYLAYYGSPRTSVLGLLGEQDPIETYERLEEDVAAYQQPDGPTVIPAFELIATVASADPDDGDYSTEADPDELRPWIDVITERGGYAIIDLQPGRTDFLTQAKQYADLLERPNVGLALDPEWRLAEDQVHLEQIGSVSAEEVNSVVDWLATLVQEHHLPQKMLVLHQFSLTMITDRDEIRTPPELAVVMHVDGQGPLATKYSTWETLLAAPIGENQELWWGWKNFLDEDDPMATPEQVNELDPLPVVVTFQ